MSATWLGEHPDTRAAVVTLAEGWFQQQQLPANGVLSNEVTWHDTLLGDQDLHGWPAVAALGRWLRTAVPDLVIKVETVVSAELQHVLLYYTATGVHTGPLAHSLAITAGSNGTCSSTAGTDVQIAASGKAVTWTGSMVLHLQQPTELGAAADAQLQVVEVWHAWDVLFLLQQIGHAPCCVPKAPAAAPAAAVSESKTYVELEVAGSQPEENKAVVQQYFQTYNSGDFSQLQLIVHPAYHYWGLIDLGGKTGVPAMHAMMSGWRDALSDFSIGNEWMLAAEGNRVLFKWRVQGIHSKGPLRGVPAEPSSARRITSWGITALSITDDRGGQPGQIWRKVSHANGAELLRQLGVCSFAVTC